MPPLPLNAPCLTYYKARSPRLLRCRQPTAKRKHRDRSGTTNKPHASQALPCRIAVVPTHNGKAETYTSLNVSEIAAKGPYSGIVWSDKKHAPRLQGPLLQECLVGPKHAPRIQGPLLQIVWPDQKHAPRLQKPSLWDCMVGPQNMLRASKGPYSGASRDQRQCGNAYKLQRASPVCHACHVIPPRKTMKEATCPNVAPTTLPCAPGLHRKNNHKYCLALQHWQSHRKASPTLAPNMFGGIWGYLLPQDHYSVHTPRQSDIGTPNV